MSNAYVIKGGVSAPVFASTLSEVVVPIRAKNSKLSAIDQVKEAARQTGYNDGYSAGSEEGFALGKAEGFEAGRAEALAQFNAAHSAQLQSLASDLQQVQANLQSTIQEWFQASEAEMERIAVKVAEKLVGAQLTLDRSFIKESVVSALAQVTEASRVRIRINPLDSATLAGCREELLASCAGLTGVEIAADSSITAGCMIETDRGVIDATLDTRLQLFTNEFPEAA